MALIDEIRAIAGRKDSYNPDLTGAHRPVTGSSGYRAPAAEVARAIRASGGTPQPQVSNGNYTPGYFSSLAAEQAKPEPGALSRAGSLAGDIFSGIIDVVDTGRAYTVSTARELTDLAAPVLNPLADVLEATPLASESDFRFDGSFDTDDLLERARNRSGVQEWLQEANPDGNKVFQGVAGFAGDVATDPLTYVGLGAVRSGAGRATAGALDNALVSGGRRELAETVVQEAARRGIADDAVDRLAREAGQRGRGAFTTRGLARANVDSTLLEELGLSKTFGYRIQRHSRATGKGVNVAGTKKLAELSNDVKGSMKKALGSSKGSNVFRKLFVGDSSALGQFERRAVAELMGGGANAADAARGLAAFKLAKADSFMWLDDSVKRLKDDIPELIKLDDLKATELTHAIESLDPDMFDGLSGKLGGFFDQLGRELQDQGVEFGWIDGYVPHRLTDRARKAMQDQDSRLLALRHGLDVDETFQNTRLLRAGDDFLNETLTEGSVREINDISQQVLGYKVLEDDVRELVSAYMSEGQRALIRAKMIDHGRATGVVKQVSQGVDDAAVDAERVVQGEVLEEAAAREAAAIQQAAQARKRVLTQAADEAKVRVDDAQRQLAEIEDGLAADWEKILGHEKTINKLQGELSIHEVAIERWGAVLKNANAQTKTKATKQIKLLEKKLDDTREALGAEMRRLDRARNAAERNVADVRVQEARQLVEVERRHLETARAAREAMDDPNLPVVGNEEIAAKVADATFGAEEVHRQFVTETKAYTDASMSWVWQMMDADSQASRLRNLMDDFDNVAKAADVEDAAALREQVRDVLRLFDANDMGPQATALRSIESQALAADMAGWQAKMTAKQARQRLDSLTDPDFQEYMKNVLDDGFRQLNDDLQISDWYDEALQVRAKLDDPGQWVAMKKALQGYDKAMNVWKGWAVTSPGFVFRNAYGGFFNMWLDGVSPKNVRVFNKFLNKYHRSTREKALRWARTQYGDDTARQLDEALQAASASGWGLTPQEVTSGLVDKRASFNPLNVEFGPTRYIREKSSNVEALMRGAHAYDAISKGSDITGAIARVEKYHFNYRDITDFDRVAKRVSPFWTFYSRNMALQAQVWTRFPHKLNRSYFNVKRNLELGSTEDQVVPGYYDELGAIRTPYGERDGGTWYLTPDLPSLRFRTDLAQITGTGDEGFNLKRILSDTGPAVKIPVEQLAGERLFTGTPFRDRLYEYESDGVTGRRAALPLQIPGVDRLVDTLVPGTEMAGGDLLITDQSEALLNDLVPLLGRASRLAPGTEAGRGNVDRAVLGTVGVPLRQNDESSIQGELYGRQLDEQRRVQAQRVLELLEAG